MYSMCLYFCSNCTAAAMRDLSCCFGKETCAEKLGSERQRGQTFPVLSPNSNTKMQFFCFCSTASTDNQFDPFSLMSTEVLAYNRILSKNSPRDEKQSFTDLINESSWPKAEFGLSPPGKSSLARRRAEVLKRKEENYKETKCAEQPMENPALTKQTFEKLSFPSYKVSEETSRIP